MEIPQDEIDLQDEIREASNRLREKEREVEEMTANLIERRNELSIMKNERFFKKILSVEVLLGALLKAEVTLPIKDAEKHL